eukprot:472430_1
MIPYLDIYEIDLFMKSKYIKKTIQKLYLTFNELSTIKYEKKNQSNTDFPSKFIRRNHQNLGSILRINSDFKDSIEDIIMSWFGECISLTQIKFIRHIQWESKLTYSSRYKLDQNIDFQNELPFKKKAKIIVDEADHNLAFYGVSKGKKVGDFYRGEVFGMLTKILQPAYINEVEHSSRIPFNKTTKTLRKFVSPETPCPSFSNVPFWDYYQAIGDISRANCAELIKVMTWISAKDIMNQFLKNWLYKTIKLPHLNYINISETLSSTFNLQPTSVIMWIRQCFNNKHPTQFDIPYLTRRYGCLDVDDNVHGDSTLVPQNKSTLNILGQNILSYVDQTTFWNCCLVSRAWLYCARGCLDCIEFKNMCNPQRNTNGHNVNIIERHNGNTVLDTLDILFAEYYIGMGKTNYFNNDGIGKCKLSFKIKDLIGDNYVELDYDEESDEETDEDIDNSNSKYLTILYDGFKIIMSTDFLSEFPFLNNTNYEQSVTDLIRITKCFYNVDKTIIRKNSRKLVWKNILEILRMEFDETSCRTLQKIIEEEKYSPSPSEIKEKLKLFQKKRNIDDNQFNWLLFLINKFGTMFESYDVNTLLSANIKQLHDVFSVHRIFINENNKTTDYGLSDFFQDLTINHNDIDALKPEEMGLLYDKTITLPPCYVINDDMESISNYIFGTTCLVNYISSFEKQSIVNTINLIIIPQSVQSLIDPDLYYKHKYLTTIQNKYEEIIVSKKVKSSTFYEIITEIYDTDAFKKQCDGTMTLIVDRQVSNNEKNDRVTFYNIQNENIVRVTGDYSLSLTFQIDINDNIVKSYLWWGKNQKVRFFPEMMVSIIPRIFNKQCFDGTDYQRMQLIHSLGFKNGVAVNLNDPRFADYYKKCTNYTHFSVNYDRTFLNKINGTTEKEIFQVKQKEIFEDNVCDGSGDLSKCTFISNLINILKSNRESCMLINKAHLDTLSTSYDHIIRVHHIYRNAQAMKKINEYFTVCVDIDSTRKGCIYEASQCPMIIQHMSTQRENSKNHGGTDSLYHFLKKKITRIDLINRLLMWHRDEEYDTESIVYDVQDNAKDIYKQSNSYNWLISAPFCNEMVTTEIYNLIKHHLAMKYDKTDDNFEDILAKRVFNSVHSYLLHSKTELYRLKNVLIDTNARFSTQVNDVKVNDENGVVSQIDFGCNVLTWLSYNESSTFIDFHDEIINNPASTITVELYEKYQVECNLLCKNAKQDLNLQEMMSVKMYTDTTMYQSALRRAFWKNSSKQEKLNFYQWAITLYTVFKRYSQPLPCFNENVKSPTPATVYHGLNNIFAIESTLPYYNGIISTTTSKNTANSFSNCTGLLWTIQASYSNRFRMLIGIPTDWFSSFKNEAEFIAFNSFIPIAETLSYARTDDEKINQLMKQLEVYSRPIIKPKTFFRYGIGFGFNRQWKDKVLKHPNLYKPTPVNNYLVIHRIVHELGKLHDTIEGQILLTKEYDIIKYGSFGQINANTRRYQIRKHDTDETQICAFLRFRLNNSEEKYTKYLENCKYLQIDDTETHSFKYNDALFVTKKSKPFTVWITNKEIFNNNKRIFLLQCDPSEINYGISEPTEQLKLNSAYINKPIMLSKRGNNTNTGGIFQLLCAKTLTIGVNGAIKGNAIAIDTQGIGRGDKLISLREEYHSGASYGGKGYDYAGNSYGAKGNDYVEQNISLRSGQTYGDKTLKTLYFGSSSYGGGGGIIELSAETIINKGLISVCGEDGGSGGSIKIRCRHFINEGVMEAKGGDDVKRRLLHVAAGGYGRISIECLQFKNTGTIYPKPYVRNVQYNQGNNFTVICDTPSVL